MNKKFKPYMLCWTILLALFNIVCFVTPNEAAGLNKFGGAFWVGYVFITAAFIGQLACAYIAFKAENLQKFFYSLSLVSVSYIGLMLTILFGSTCMAIPDLPNWVGVIVCLLTLAINAIAIIKASAAIDIVSDVDDKVKANLSFMRELTEEAQNLVNRASAPMLKEQCKKVYAAFRYSDPISNDALTDIETRIREELNVLTDAVAADDLDLTESSAKELINLITERNAKCKKAKQC